MDKEAFLWLGTLFMVAAFISLSSSAFRIHDLGFGAFLGLILIPISLASVAAGTLEGSRKKMATIFLVYVVFFSVIIFIPSIVSI